MLWFMVYCLVKGYWALWVYGSGFRAQVEGPCRRSMYLIESLIITLNSPPVVSFNCMVQGLGAQEGSG